MLFLEIKILFPSRSRSSEASYYFVVMCIFLSRGHLHLTPVLLPEPQLLLDDDRPPQLNPGASLSFTQFLLLLGRGCVHLLQVFKMTGESDAIWSSLRGWCAFKGTKEHRPALLFLHGAPWKWRLLTLNVLPKWEACWLSQKPQDGLVFWNSLCFFCIESMFPTPCFTVILPGEATSGK